MNVLGSLLIFSQQIRWLIRLYNFVETNPVISIDFAAKKLGIAYNTAAKDVKILQKLGILEKNNDQLRYRIYSNSKLLRIFEFYN